MAKVRFGSDSNRAQFCWLLDERWIAYRIEGRFQDQVLFQDPEGDLLPLAIDCGGEVVG